MPEAPTAAASVASQDPYVSFPNSLKKFTTPVSSVKRL
jgi:hypothetical protein